VTPLGSGATGIWERCSWVLNQDFQDFEDFLALDIGLDGVRSSMLFESGFSGFRGLTITPLV
jgi:hypothetical protein